MVPQLLVEDVRAILERLYEKERRHSLVAIHGSGAEGVVAGSGFGQFEVVPVRSELELRRRLPPLGEERQVAYLVPWRGQIPLDVAGRFVLGGRVLTTSRGARLAAMFGVREADDEAVRSPLAEYLLATGAEQGHRIAGTRLTHDALMATWLRDAFGVPTDGGWARDAVLGWAALDGGGGRFRERMVAAEAAGVREAVLAHVEQMLGAVGRVAFEAWERGEGRAALELAVVLEPLAKNDDGAVRMWVKQAVASVLGVEDDAARAAVAAQLGEAAGGALRWFEAKAGEAEVRALLAAADRRVTYPEVRAALAEDNRLPSAWQMQLDRFGELLVAGAARPEAKVVERAHASLRKLEAHLAARDPNQHRLLDRAWMAARLLGWLAETPEGWPEPGATRYADAETLAGWYAMDGGFVDLARRRARGTAEGAFGKGVQAVVEAADRLRDALDGRFARGLASWIEAGRASTRVVPIDQAVSRIAVRFLEERPERRLLVLLLDGMAWAQAVELLADLGASHAPWGPLAWHGSKQGAIGEQAYPAVLANVPTITEVSRAAFFAGKPMPPGKRPVTSDDPARWREHPAVAKLLPANDPPRLLLRGESHTGSGVASNEALSLVGDASRRVVAIVINAIDASLKSDPQQDHRWTADSIRSLRDLLEKARATGRAVLLASDHGHVPADRMKAVPQPTNGGARWRSLTREGEAVASYEVAVSGSGVFSERGAPGVVLLANETTRYGGGTGAGEHGGATLAEVVAPCLLIGCEDDVPDDDTGQRVLPAHSPRWWHLDVREAAQVPASQRVPVRPKKKADERQMSLESVVALEAPAAEGRRAAVETTGRRAAVEALGRSKLFAARAGAKGEREKVLVAVEYLLERNGVASGVAFAAAMQVLPFRVQGYVATLAEVLNVDGYLVIQYDHASGQVRLDREKLAQQFEVDLDDRG